MYSELELIELKSLIYYNKRVKSLQKELKQSYFDMLPYYLFMLTLVVMLSTFISIPMYSFINLGKRVISDYVFGSLVLSIIIIILFMFISNGMLLSYEQKQIIKCMKVYLFLECLARESEKGNLEKVWYCSGKIYFISKKRIRGSKKYKNNVYLYSLPSNIATQLKRG